MRRLSLVLPLLAAGCITRPMRGEEGAPRAVVLSRAEQDSVSSRLAQALHDRGYDVTRKSTTLRRAKSSMAIYDIRHHPERVDALARLVRDDLALPIEVLPFPQHATGGNAVVVWLGDDVRTP
jgi:hypothetical protein